MASKGAVDRVPVTMRWVHRESPEEVRGELARTLGISDLLAHLLIQRRICDQDSGREFLTARMSALPEPGLLPDIDSAAARLERAIRDHQCVLVHGDYDVDGLSGAAILYRMIKHLGGDVRVFIPDRQADGYGLRSQRMRQFASEGVNLIITVDTGTSAVEAISVARECGVDVIVTDHHEPPATLPAGALIVNPKLASSRHPCRYLSGAGVAFHLAWKLATVVSGSSRVSETLRAHLVESLALACLGTVADVVPLLGANRIIVREGLRQLGTTKSPGLAALRGISRLADKSRLDAVDIGFQLAPRLNAAGRMGKGELAFELLTTDSRERATAIAAELDSANRERREIESRIHLEVVKSMTSDPRLEDAPIIVLGSSEWHLGVIGIVASRIVERTARPVMLVSFDATGLGRGSCRSIPGFELHTALSRCSANLLAHGGHAQAAGFEIRQENFAAFAESMREYAAGVLAELDTTQVLDLDAVLELATVEQNMVDELTLLYPHGEGNPVPLFGAYDLEIAGKPRRVGTSGEHLSFMIKSGAGAIRAIAFGQGDHETMVKSVRFDAAFEIAFNDWQGKRSIQLIVKRLRASGRSSP